VLPDTRAFWEGLTRGELVMAWCTECDDHVWPPKSVCPSCLHTVTDTRFLTGEGVVYAFSVVHRGEGPFTDYVPYVLAYVSVDGGPTLMANVVAADLSQLEVGMRVRLIDRDGSLSAGHVGNVFEPV